MATTHSPNPNQTAVLGGGCFWCLEAAFQQIAGIEAVTSGYAGGQQASPSYDEVSAGTTGHAEVVQLQFDPDIISYRDILEIFWTIHDPTTKDRQGHDQGSQYRSIILYANDEQQQAAEASKKQVQTLWPQPVVTEVMPLRQFYPAEDYHQNYFRNHPEQAYCQIVINPKLQHLRERFASRLKVQ